jgi:predicted DNA binding CopG/RHH family protein
MSTPKLLKTDSIQELAEFWDTHDLTDFENELEEVKEPIFEHKAFVKIDLQPQAIEVVEEMAKQQGVSYIDLMRQWILEKVRAS